MNPSNLSLPVGCATHPVLRKLHGIPEVSIYLAVFTRNIFLPIFWHPSDQMCDFILQRCSVSMCHTGHSVGCCLGKCKLWMLLALEILQLGELVPSQHLLGAPAPVTAVPCRGTEDWNGSQPAQCYARRRKCDSSKSSAVGSRHWGWPLSCRVLS